MADTARNDPEAVRRLGQALDRYMRDTETGLDTVKFARARVDRDLTAETEARRRALERARGTYASCMTGGGTCSAEKHELDRAAAALAAAHRARRIFDTAAAQYDPAAARFGRAVNSLTVEAKRLLGSVAADLDQYGRTTTHPGPANTPSYRDTAPVDAPSGPADIIIPVIERPPGFPEGFGLVPLALIDASDSQVHGPADFPADVTPADLEWGFDAFYRVIVPALALGRDLDYFRSRDAAENRFGARSYADTYTSFLGHNEAPRLALRTDGRYRVENGFHRVWVAQRLGLPAIPGEVIER